MIFSSSKSLTVNESTSSCPDEKSAREELGRTTRTEPPSLPDDIFMQETNASNNAGKIENANFFIIPPKKIVRMTYYYYSISNSS